MEKGSRTDCYHCGQNCGSHPVLFDDKPFCCNGCKTVYEILRERDACDYYTIGAYPGIRIKEEEIGQKYAYLDHEEVVGDLLDFSDGGVGKIRLFIPSIHCSACIWLLENLGKFHEGIIHSQVNFIKKELSVTFRQEKLSLRSLVELLVSLNYVPQITLDDISRKAARKGQRKIYYQLGVAGFCFGNIMLFSFPDYLAGDQPIDQGFIHSFAYFSLILAIPVVFYAAQDYFISAWKGLIKKIITLDVPIALGIIALFGRSVYDILSATGPGFLDSLAGLVFFLLIGKWYQGKTYQALSFERDFKSYFPVAVTLRDDHGGESTIPLKNLRPGHKILVRNQELIPADAILTGGEAHIDYSFVSGESTPVTKRTGDRIFAGGRQVGSLIELIVEKEVVQSYLTELWNQDLHADPGKRNLNTLVDRVSRYFTIGILLISLSALTYWLINDPAQAMNAFTSVLIVACPCALALTIPFAFGNTMRIFGRKGFYLKKTEVLEELAHIDTIVFDKTGTITRNDQFEIDQNLLQCTQDELILVKSLVRHSSHPLSQAIYLSIPGDILTDIKFYEEVPAMGIRARINGRLVLAGSEEFIRNEGFVPQTYSTQVFISIDGEIKGFFGIRNMYRPGTGEVITGLGRKYGLHLLSGDNSGELPNLLPLFGEKERIHFRQSPKNKLEYIRVLKSGGKRVMMVGDGLNDAGALKESDIGVTIADNVYHFSPACDAILDSNRFSDLPRFISFSHTALRVVWAGFILSFIYNIIGISFAAAGMLTPLLSAILMPLSSVSVVAFASFSVILLARKRL